MSLSPGSGNAPATLLSYRTRPLSGGAIPLLPGPDILTQANPNERHARRVLIAISLCLPIGAVLLWRYTPLSHWAEPQRVAEAMARIGDFAWAPLVVVLVFVVGGFVAFPLTLLITATAVVFAPITAVITALSGALASALSLYGVGHTFMRETVNHAFAKHVEKLRRALAHSGIVAVATIRMVPIAPFSLVNLAAGSIGVRLRDYMLGTLLGLLPGTLALTAFGRQLRAIVEHPTPANVGLLLAAIAAWIGLSIGLQRWVARRKPPRADDR